MRIPQFEIKRLVKQFDDIHSLVDVSPGIEP